MSHLGTNECNDYSQIFNSETIYCLRKKGNFELKTYPQTTFKLHSKGGILILLIDTAFGNCKKGIPAN